MNRRVYINMLYIPDILLLSNNDIAEHAGFLGILFANVSKTAVGRLLDSLGLTDKIRTDHTGARSIPRQTTHACTSGSWLAERLLQQQHVVV